MIPKILIADDHSMIRKGLNLNLQLTLGYTDITEVSSCGDLMKVLIKQKFTHIILDLNLADGSTLEVLPNIQRVYPHISILVFSMMPAEIYSQALKQYGIKYYLSKAVGEDELVAVLKKFLRDELTTFNHKVSENTNPFTALAPRELEILHYMMKGIGTKAISENLNLKMNTVSTLKTRILEKTKVNNLKELLELATLYNVNC